VSFAKDLVAGFDVPAEPAEDMVSHVDGPMKDSILKLYRSALMVGAEWEPALANVSAPALVFWGALDPACQVEFGEKLGLAMQASQVMRLGCNHGTVLQKPAEVAAALEAHWNQPK
jgi:pimeloyl-ACP methyl ester carboxylesterase